MDERIIKRMKKLLAMSQDSSSESEALIATKQLHALLAKHNIGMMDLVESPDTKVNQDCFESVDWYWRRLVICSIAELYFCAMYSVKTRKNYANYFIVGTKINREYAISLSNIVINLIEREAKKSCKEYHGQIVSSYITSFRTGAAVRISNRCIELIKQAKEGQLKDEGGNNLPALACLYDQHKHANALFTEDLGLFTRKSSTRTRSGVGYTAGKAAGDKVNLNTGIHNQSSPKMLGVNK